jgi:RNA-directed DNA polymerase
MVVAYLGCRATKRNSWNARAFEAHLERNLGDLAEELRSGTYRPGRSICFVITRPKPREVWAAGFRDRVVHHLLYNRIAPRFEAAFVAGSAACIAGRGTAYAATRMESDVRSITRNWSRRAWYLKCDLRNFFVSIDRRILAELLCGRVSGWWRDLALQILWHDPRVDAEVQSSPERLQLIPRHKSLWNAPAHQGLPIGNLSSQFFANVYLDVLDQHVKHRLRCRHYVRYVDDFILLHESPQQLNAWRAELEDVLATALRLEINPAKTVLQPIERGVDVVGQVIRPWRRTIRRRTVAETLHRLGADDGPALESWNSHFGLLRQASHSHVDRARVARLAMSQGRVVDRALTRTFRLSHERSSHGAR